MATKQESFDLGGEVGDAKRLWVKSGESLWVYDPGKTIESHDPMDRVGGPFSISALVADDGGDRWFLFAVVDCYFPLHDLVRGESWESAYETYCDWAADHRHIAIDEPDLADYDADSLTYSGNGTPIDTDNIQGSEVYLHQIDF